MRLHVRLGDEVDAVLVADVVPESVVRIVARAYRVDVVPLHQLRVAQHLGARHGAPVLGTRLVPVHTLELDRLAVHVEHLAHDLLLLEADALRADVVATLQHKRIEIRFLRAPKIGILYLEIQSCCCTLVVSHAITSTHLLELCVVQRRTYTLRVAVGFHLHVHGCALVPLAELLRDDEICDAGLRTRPERHVAEESGEAQHVLVLHVAAIAPAEHLHGDLVLAVLQERRDVELARQLGVLGVSDFLAVDPGIECRARALEAEDRLATFPRVRQVELAFVGHDGVVVGTSRLLVEDLRPRELVRIAVGDVVRHPVAAHLHAAGDVDRLPLRHVVRRALEHKRTALRIAAPVELPRPVQRHLPRRLELQRIGERSILVRQRHRIRCRRHPVERADFDVLPVAHDGCTTVRLFRSGREPEGQANGNGKKE